MADNIDILVSRMVRIGKVVARDTVKGLVRVHFPDTGMTSGWLPVLRGAYGYAERRSDFVSIKDYGAYGDGVHDDTEAIKSAAASGKMIFFPKGTYLLGSQIDMSRDINFVGEGNDSVIKLIPKDKSRPEQYGGRTVYNCYMFAQTKNVNTGYALSLHGICLDANKDAFDNDELDNGASRYDHTTCIDLYRPGNVTLDHVKITNALIEGCYIYRHNNDTSVVKINDCEFSNNGFYREDASGLHIEGNHKNTVVSNIVCNNNGFHGLLMSCFYASVSNVTCKKNGFSGLMLWGGASRNNVVNVQTEANAVGISIKSSYMPTAADSFEDWMNLAEGNVLTNINSRSNAYCLAIGNSKNTTISCVNSTDASSIRYIWSVSETITGLILGSVFDYTDQKISYNTGADASLCSVVIQDAAKLDDVFYKPGDVIDLTETTSIISGVVRNSAKSLIMTIPVAKRLDLITSVTINNFSGNADTPDGKYIEGKSGNSSWVTSDYTVTATVNAGVNAINVTIEKATAMTNATNLTPFVMLVKAKFTLQ